LLCNSFYVEIYIVQRLPLLMREGYLGFTDCWHWVVRTSLRFTIPYSVIANYKFNFL